MFTVLFLAAVGSTAYAQTSPAHAGTGPGTWEIVGESGVSAQQLFLGTDSKVYVIDKTQNNAAHVNDHPAWATEYDINTNTYRTMDVVTNTFCAGGNLLADGRWLVVGGNQPVTTGGNTTQVGGPDPYKGQDGGNSMRLLKPCSDQSCNFAYETMSGRRWYPTLETLPDGSIIILGGDLWGGYVNNEGNNNPTYEFYPSRGAPVHSQFLVDTLPVNLYPLVWLLPSGKLFMQSNWATITLDWESGQETKLADMTHAVRVYPASAATGMWPMTPANNYTATMLFCGGTDLQSDQWTAPGIRIIDLPTVKSCVTISPDVDANYKDDDDLPEGRTMANFINLPDGTLFLCNGGGVGTAGYGTEQWTVGESYSDNALLQPWIYDPSAPAGKRFSKEGLQPSTIPRMYHSTATLLPDGSVFVAGSSPHADVVLENTKFPTEYRVERFYPWYYQKTRPDPKGIPASVSYGGKPFDLTLTPGDLNNDGVTALDQTKVVLMRTGYATHAINFGMRHVELATSYTLNKDGSATLHVAQLPPNAAVLAPGPAWMFVVVNGVPSIGKEVMVGSGKIETQAVQAASVLPANSVPKGTTLSGSSSTGSGTANDDEENLNPSDSAAPRSVKGAAGLVAAVAAAVVAGFSLL